MAKGVEPALDALHEVTQRLMRAETEQDICNVAVDAVPEVFGVPFAGLWLYDAEASELQQVAETEQGRKILDDDVIYRPGNSLSWEAFSEGEYRTYSGTDEETLYNADSRISSELILPIGDHGVMNIGTPAPDAFDSTVIQIGKLLAANVEAALRKTEREHALNVKNDRLEEFVSMVSHDLRNPLTVADGNLQLAQQESDSEHLDNVEAAIERMDTLIDELLTLAEHGYVVENRTTLDLELLAKRAWSNVHTPQANLRIIGTTRVFGDQPSLLQVFENLYRNSIEHATATDVTIQVGPFQTMHTSTRVDDSERTDGFYVADDGPGIPDAEKPSIFDSGHSTSGTGLGLTIVKRIVDSHGWDISVSDAVPRGARFEITGGAKSVSPFDS